MAGASRGSGWGRWTRAAPRRTRKRPVRRRVREPPARRRTRPPARRGRRTPPARRRASGPLPRHRARGRRPAPAGLLAAGVPVLGICYGFQLMVSGLGGSVAHTGAGEYGATAMDLLPSPAAVGGPDADAATLPGGVLLSGLPQRQQVWMSHGATCTVAP